MTPVKFAQAIPTRARQFVYSVLVALYGFELVWDVVETDLEAKLLASASVLGFGIALSNTNR